jgi:hypothetical protein
MCRLTESGLWLGIQGTASCEPMKEIMAGRSNERWRADALEFTCWNGEIVRIAFALDIIRTAIFGCRLPSCGDIAVIRAMGAKSREVIWGGRIMGAEIRTKGAREAALKAALEADRAEAEGVVVSVGRLWRACAAVPYDRSVPPQRSGLAGRQMRPCETKTSIPLDAIRRPGHTPIWKLEASLKCRSCCKSRHVPPAHMARPIEGAHAVQVGSIRTTKNDRAAGAERQRAAAEHHQSQRLR